MTSRPETFESDSYREICEQIFERGKHRFGESGYSRIIFTNGCFDILHVGHLKLLDECRNLAGPKGAVVVGVNSDESVRRIKGPTRPVNDERTRCLMLVHMKPVDHVITFDEDTPLKLVEMLRPDVIVKGGDYRGKDVVGSHLAAVVLVPVEEGISSTTLLERMRQREE
jgi:D-beta-D-heptose 7-phosphate kinase/D-beta-D-heptose 1-phosphate adenosyltransferase